jgi:hypothetical protein
MKNVFSSTLKHLVFILSMTFMLVSCDKKDETADTITSTQTEKKSFQDEPQSIAALISAYQQAHRNEPLDSFRVTTVFNQFVNMMGSNKSFEGKKPCRIQPIYAAGEKGVAYYEIWFAKSDKTVEGWVLMSATEKDYPIVNYSHGTPYSANMMDKAGTDDKVFRFGVSYYTLEHNGKKIAEFGQMPAFIANPASKNKGESGGYDSKDPSVSANNGKVQLKEGEDFFTIGSYEQLKELYAKYYYTENRKRVANRMNDKFFSTDLTKSLNTRGAYQYRWVSGQTGNYTQIAPNYFYNYTSCYSGCNNNAWANIYAWWDGTGGKGNLIPTTTTGETTPIFRNSLSRLAASDPVQMYCNRVCGTFCDGLGGGTYWSKAWLGNEYVKNKYYYTFYYQWCANAGGNVNLANLVTDGVATYGSPVHIGSNSHFYVGIGQSQWDSNTDWTWAYCYPGWSENERDNVWIIWHDWYSSLKMFIH